MLLLVMAAAMHWWGRGLPRGIMALLLVQCAASCPIACQLHTCSCIQCHDCCCWWNKAVTTTVFLLLQLLLLLLLLLGALTLHFITLPAANLEWLLLLCRLLNNTTIINVHAVTCPFTFPSTGPSCCDMTVTNVCAAALLGRQCSSARPSTSRTAAVCMCSRTTLTHTIQCTAAATATCWSSSSSGSRIGGKALKSACCCHMLS
jgi:hypothetical protein